MYCCGDLRLCREPWQSCCLLRKVHLFPWHVYFPNHVFTVSPSVQGQWLVECTMCERPDAGWRRHRCGHRGVLPDAAGKRCPHGAGQRTEVDPTCCTYAHYPLGDTVARLLHSTIQRKAEHIESSAVYSECITPRFFGVVTERIRAYLSLCLVHKSLIWRIELQQICPGSSVG